MNTALLSDIPLPVILLVLYILAGIGLGAFVAVKELLGLTRVSARKYLIAGLIYLTGLLILHVVSLLALRTEPHINVQGVFLSLICVAPPLLLTLLGGYIGSRRLDAMRKEK